VASNLVLLPGLDGTGRLFAPLLAALPKDIRTNVVSYPANELLDLPALASLVQRQMPVGKSVLLAESFSGLVALALLGEAPSKVGAVCFVGAFAEPPRPFLLRLAPLASRSAALLRSTPAFLLRQYCLGSDATAAQLRLLRESLASVSPKVLGQRLSIVAARHSFGKPVDIPCCYMRASQDRLVPATCSDWFERKFRRCELREIDGPHFLLQARPIEAAQAVASFMNGLDGE
jgi:pimeloyl-[acyl-carrier protein] methyl ester esterase